MKNKKWHTWCYADVCARRLRGRLESLLLHPCALCVVRASRPCSVATPVPGCSPYFRLRDYFRCDLPPPCPAGSCRRPMAKLRNVRKHTDYQSWSTGISFFDQQFLSFLFFALLFSPFFSSIYMYNDYISIIYLYMYRHIQAFFFLALPLVGDLSKNRGRMWNDYKDRKHSKSRINSIKKRWERILRIKRRPC